MFIKEASINFLEGNLCFFILRTYILECLPCHPPAQPNAEIMLEPMSHPSCCVSMHSSHHGVERQYEEN